MTIINPNSISGITSVTAQAGVMNFYKSDGSLSGLQLNGVNFNTTAGVSTFNNLKVRGTITYEDVKNVDSIGIVTARGGLNVTANTDTDTLNVSGISTFGGYVYIPEYLIHSGDTNTWFRFPSNDNITFGTSGAERVRIDANGFVAIGHDTPSSFSSGANNLVVRDASGAGGITIVTPNNAMGSIFFADGTSGSGQGRIRYDHNGDYMTINTNATERLRITSGGNLLVGRSGDYWNSRAAFQENKQGRTQILVKNDTNHADASSCIALNAHGNSWVMDCGSGAKNSNALTFALDASSATPTEKFRITTAGKIGINESSPTSLLQITDGSSASTPFIHLKGANEHASIRLENTADNPDNVWQILPSISGVSNTGFTIRDVTDSANRLVIDGTGKIGIGINAPARLLHLHEFGGIEAMIHFSTSATGTSASDGFRVGVNGSEEAIVWNNESGIIKFGTANNERFRIDASGRVIVGGGTHAGGGQLVVMGGNINTYAAAAFGNKVTAPTDNTTFAMFRFNSGSAGTSRGAEIIAAADANWSAGSSYPTRLVFSTTASSATSSTERLRIDSEGKLWSNRTTSSTSGNHPCLDIETHSSGSEDATFATGIDFRVDGVHKKRLAITRGATASTVGDGDWIFYRDHGGNEAVRINAAGKVLIGTSTPQGNGNADDLVVATSGTTGITIRSGTSNNGNLFFADGTSGADEYRGWVTYDHSQNHLTFGTNGQETFRAYSGRFGIGTASPTRTLEVRGPSDSHLAVTVPGTTQTSALLFGDSGDDDVGAISYIHSDNSMRFVTNTGERLRITNDGTLYSYSPDDATPNIAIRSNDTNWHGYLTQTVHGGTISSILSCGGKWNVDGTTYSGTKDYNGSFPTCALVLHNQYNGSNGGHLVFLQKGAGSSTTDGTVTERLRIDQNGKLTVNSDSEPQVDVQATSAAGASMRVQSAGQYAYHMIVGSARHWRIGLPTGGTTFAIRDNTGGYNVLECNTIRSTKFLGSGTDVEIFPTDGMINYGQDGRNSYVTSTNGCYIFSGSGSSDGATDLPAGTLVLQSRSNVDRDIVFATGSSPSEKLRIRRDGKIWKQSNQIYPVIKVQTITTNGSTSLSGSGSWQTMHTLTIDPVKSGSKLWCHWQIQTWWGSTSDGSGDIYVKIDENSSGSWSTFFQNDRIAGNFDQHERRHHNTIDLVDTFPCSTASSFNIRLEAYASGNMGNANFNFFHTNSGNFFHFMEFDVA